MSRSTRQGRRQEWVSGFDEYRKQADDLADELGLGRLWTTSHVEIKFAMFMRERGLTNARLILNNIPCDDEEFSCENLLIRFLPPGAKLTIYAPENFKRTYSTSDDGSSR
ncbi:DddA-like double-stranded DNA deaminase toxin [Kribbella sp. NPDC056861]|uniref:DddA-like double-stranded DNA deaminase toxin n=1 Tax=Kribbella sp. NPDC056861 TaxID=3154857 RepID=UPI00344037EF